MSERWFIEAANQGWGRMHLYQKRGERLKLEIRASCRWSAVQKRRRKVPRAGSKLAAAKKLLAFPEGQRCVTCSQTAMRVVKESQ